MDDIERPSLAHLNDTDWFRVATTLISLLLTLLCVSFCVTALIAYTQGQIGTAIVMALIGSVLRPNYGWR